MMSSPRRPDRSTGALRHREKRAFASTAQMVEVATMLLVVTCALGVTAVLLAGALVRVRTSATTEAATRAAANAAEAFSADPTAAPASQEVEGLTVTCDATPEPHRDGTLWRAHIAVADAAGTTVLELDTARYVASAVAPEGATATSPGAASATGSASATGRSADATGSEGGAA